MKPSTLEWIKKAESDYQAALSLSRRRKVSFHDEVYDARQQARAIRKEARLAPGLTV